MENKSYESKLIDARYENTLIDVKRTIEEIKGISPISIKEKTKIKDLNMDSLEIVDFGLSLEDKLNIIIPDDYMEEFFKIEESLSFHTPNESKYPTVKEFTEYLCELMKNN